MRKEEDEVHENERRPHNREDTAYVRAEESGVERDYRTNGQKENAGQRHRFFQGHVFPSDDDLNIRMIDRNALAAVHFILLIKDIKSSPFEPKFSACPQHGTFKFSRFSQVPAILLQLLTRSDTISKHLRPTLQSYNVVLIMAPIIATALSLHGKALS